MKKIIFVIVWLSCTMAVQAQSEKYWSVNGGGGYMSTSNFSTDVAALNVGVQRHLSDYFSFGAGTGMYYCNGAIIPVYADIRGYYPIYDSRFSWIGLFRTGVGIHTEEGYTALGIELLPGIRINISERSFLHVNLGIGSYDGKTMGTIQLGYSHTL